MKEAKKEKRRFARRSISFEDDVVEFVENWRRKQDKIPSFSKAVNELLRKAQANE